jgi:ketosteroid isomerase-like protein
MPWVRIPAATVTFSGTARVLEQHQLDERLFEKLYRHDAERSGWRAIEVTPYGHFVTYGIGVPLWAMRSPDRSRARVPVDAARPANTESAMSPCSPAQQANLELVAQVGALIGSGFADPDEDLFAPDFVFHFVNPNLPDLDGDHHGLDGMRRLFERLEQTSDTGFRNEPHSLTPYGNELVVAYATNTLSFAGTELEVDAIVVWRVVDGRVREAWDIPAINTVRPHGSDAF